MDFEAGVLAAMAIGIIVGGFLTAWCIWSRYQELKEDHKA